jgi:hypothetical protein
MSPRTQVPPAEKSGGLQAVSDLLEKCVATFEAEHGEIDVTPNDFDDVRETSSAGMPDTTKAA